MKKRKNIQCNNIYLNYKITTNYTTLKKNELSFENRTTLTNIIVTIK